MTEDSCCAENEKLNCAVLIIMISIRLYVVNHHLIRFIHNFFFGLGLGLDLKKLTSASALTSKLWPRSRPRDFVLV